MEDVKGCAVLFPSTHYNSKGKGSDGKISPLDAAPNACGEVMTNECFDDIQTAVRKDLQEAVANQNRTSDSARQFVEITDPCQGVLRDGLPKSCKGLDGRVQSRVNAGELDSPQLLALEVSEGAMVQFMAVAHYELLYTLALAGFGVVMRLHTLRVGL